MSEQLRNEFVEWASETSGRVSEDNQLAEICAEHAKVENIVPQPVIIIVTGVGRKQKSFANRMNMTE